MLYIIQNDPDVPAGIILEQLTETQTGFCIVELYRNEALPSLNPDDAVLVLGGAMGANDDLKHPFLTDLKQFIAEVVDRGIAYLGICLGGQLLAAATGGKVHSNRWEELGTLHVSLTKQAADDPLFKSLDNDFITFQWHHDSFDIPPQAVLLATSHACSNQAFRLGSRAWGLQFHPEVNESIIRNWSAWDPEHAARADQLVREWRKVETEYRKISAKIVKSFIAVAQTYH